MAEDASAARIRMQEVAAAMARPLTDEQRAARAGAVAMIRQIAAQEGADRSLFRSTRERIERARAAQAETGVRASLGDDGGRDLD
jgi:hypothetical protein